MISYQAVLFHDAEDHGMNCHCFGNLTVLMGPEWRSILSIMHYIRWIQKWLWRKYIN